MIYNIIRIILYPIVRFIIPLLSKKIRAQLKQELEYRNHEVVDYIFHISSEGELEQSLSLIDYLLKDSKVLVIFTSKSVRNTLGSLCLSNQNLFMEALPIITYFPFFSKSIRKYKNIKSFFMVRYDFFPELIEFSYKNSSCLLNASLKAKENMKGIKRLYTSYALNSFDKIITASKEESIRFKQLGIYTPLFDFDLRVLRILERKRKSLATIEEKIEDYDSFISLLTNSTFSSKVILGSYWNTEFFELSLPIKKSIESNQLVLCAPHDFKHIDSLKETFDVNNIDFIVCSENSNFKEVAKKIKAQNAVIILTAKGILCELYQFFDHAYIAGGWHRSIHSVLEPFIMGANFISCGPNTFRSTEFDLVKELDSSRIKSYHHIYEFFYKSESREFDTNFSDRFIKLVEFLEI